VLAGARLGDLPAELQRVLHGLESRVVLPGVVPIAEAARWMARFDVALSLYPPVEAFYFSPVKLFEYMASGTAVVATAIGQQGQIVRDGVNGLLVPPGDARAARAAVETLVGDRVLRQRLGAAARKTIVDHYTWAHNARRIAELCERVVHRSPDVVVSGDDFSPSRAIP
jgi:glycosyltransferase involved in cell wall biosynthesis